MINRFASGFTDRAAFARIIKRVSKVNLALLRCSSKLSFWAPDAITDLHQMSNILNNPA